MKYIFTLAMDQGPMWDPATGLRQIEADSISIESGHYVFHDHSLGGPGVVQTIAMSRVMELHTQLSPIAEPAPQVDPDWNSPRDVVRCGQPDCLFDGSPHDHGVTPE